MRPTIITIAGKPGSGKSTTANLVAEALGFERYSAGSFFRELAAKRGMSIEEINRLALTDPTLDKEADAALQEIGHTRSNLVIDSRLAFHFIPDSFKVYLELDLATAAARIFNKSSDERKKSGEAPATREELLQSIERRFAIEQKRYLDLYGIDPYDHNHFDLVLDTSKVPPEAVATRIIEAYKASFDA